MAGEIWVLPTVSELTMPQVVDGGIPNRERVYMRALVDVPLGSYFLTTGWRVAYDHALPLNMEVLWLGSLTVSAGTWVVAYTAPGEQKVGAMDNGEPGLILHWGKTTTIFNLPEIVPVLLRTDGISVGTHYAPPALGA
jgi:hypothetical protein